MTDKELAALLPPLAEDANKYTRGSLLVLAGSTRFPGAAILATKAAMRTGAGYVTLATPQPVVAVAQSHLLSAPVIAAPAEDGAFAADAFSLIRSQLRHIDAIVLGPGLTVTPSICAFVASVLKGATAGTSGTTVGATPSAIAGAADTTSAAIPLLLDADALTILATLIADGEVPVAPPITAPTALAASTATSTAASQAVILGLSQNLNERVCTQTDGAAAAPSTSSVVLTPHAGELQRLSNAVGTQDVVQLAQLLNVTVVAKGPTTRIVSPERYYESQSGTPALAKAGTGDVLSGIIGSLMAQGLTPFDAALLGVELHSRAGCEAERRLGCRSVCAEDVVESLCTVLRELPR